MDTPQPSTTEDMKPVRIQRSRKHKQVSPNGLPIVYVGRRSKWGNPHKVGISLAKNGDGTYRRMTAKDAVERYENEYLPYWMWKASENQLDVSELKGKNLSCWCKIGEPCHADILLKLANEPSIKTP